MIGVLYLASLLGALACILLVDRRFALFFWRDARSAAAVTALGVLFFVLWDLAGISMGIFLRGDGPFATGILLAPELPLEEPIFLAFLAVCTMVLYTGAERMLAGRRGEDS